MVWIPSLDFLVRRGPPSMTKFDSLTRGDEICENSTLSGIRARRGRGRVGRMGTCASLYDDVHPISGYNQRLSREQKRAVEEYLPDFQIYEPSTEKHRQTAATHWQAVFHEETFNRSTRSTQTDAITRQRQAPRMKKTQSDSRIGVLYDAFYTYLDDYSPELKPVFRSSMHVRSKVLVHISAGMRSILATDQVMEKTMALTKTHLRFGVKLENFNALGMALLHAMKVASEDAWTPEVEDAWRRLFTHCSAILLVQHKKALQRKALSKQTDVHHTPALPSQAEHVWN